MVVQCVSVGSKGEVRGSTEGKWVCGDGGRSRGRVGARGDVWKG